MLMKYKSIGNVNYCFVVVVHNHGFSELDVQAINNKEFKTYEQLN